MRVRLEAEPCGLFLLIPVHANGRRVRDLDAIAVQSDWDYPGVASSFGYVPCDCGRTDGTVDCDHRSAGDMIADAGEFLREHDGETIDDPGYFD
ncbi:MAG: hypothetical protein U0793_03470 [Gemmataceae bacterium]